MLLKLFRVVLATCGWCIVFLMSGQGQAPSAALPLGLFERYLDALRLDFGIPGLTAAVIDDNRLWERGFGFANLASGTSATPTTPFPIAGLTQSIGASLVFYHCIDSGRGELSDRILRWTPFAEPTTTIGHLLAHVSPSGGFRYDPGRYSTLTDVVSECAQREFDALLANDIFDRFGMSDAVPGRDATASRQSTFSATQLAKYTSALARLAVPYRLDARRTPTRSDDSATGVSASTGVIASVRDLVQFDAALGDTVLLSQEARELSWNSSPGRPTGLGWFVQSYNGQRLVWQFGLVQDAYSALMLKVPDRQLTLILLANSDSLTNAINPQSPDVTQSLFARAFLRLYLP
jgi:CubicO group peptidase (beta-lactamase class C family)